MVTAIVIAIFVTAFVLIWYSILYLLKHPNIDFHLDEQVLAHEPGLDEKVLKIRTYLHNEEQASIKELAILLAITEHEVLQIVNLLAKNNVLVIHEIEDQLIVEQL